MREDRYIHPSAGRLAALTPAPTRAGSILRHARENLAPYKRVRRLEFTELPKTISGKIRRVELRTTERERGDVRPDGEYRDEDFPDLKS